MSERAPEAARPGQGDPLAAWTSEMQAAYLYRVMAAVEDGTAPAGLFRDLAAESETQAGVWAGQARVGGHAVPPAYEPSARLRLVAWLVRRVGVRPLLPVLSAMKVRGLSVYRGRQAGHPMPTSTGPEPYRHRGISQGGTLRAAVFGVNDGLVSNTSLILGMAGASGNPRVVLLSGIAGLLAGAFSMAAGEFISMRSQRELFEYQIALERDELATYPAEEAEELALVYAARGLPLAEARSIAERLIADPEHALDTLAREELGLNPDELGSPWGAALFSFLAFAVGGFVPLLPFLVGAGSHAVVWAAGLAVVGLFAVGGSLSLFTGRNALWSGLRMVLIGALAGGTTYLIGSLLGVNLS